MRRALPLLLLALAMGAWFGTLGWRDLIHPDEGRYAELSRQMLASGDWITPRLNGILYFEKPALAYWAGAAAQALLGPTAFAARLWPGVIGAFTVLCLWLGARRVLGAKPALAAACVLGSCVWWLGNSHFLNLDTGLSAFLALAMLGFWSAQRDRASPTEQRLGMWLAWLAMALALLTKGLIGIVLPGLALVAYSLMARDLRPWLRMHWISGLLLFALVAVPWFAMVSLRNPDFAHFFFIEQHFHRFLTHDHRPGPWWYFLPVLAVGLLPWTTLLPGALALGWRRTPGRFQGNRLLLAWILAIFAFFSLSGSKLPSYILPIFPALALLIGQHLQRMPTRRLGVHAALIGVLCIGAALLLVALTLGWIGGPKRFSPQELAYRDWILAGLAVITLLAMLASHLARGGSANGAVVALCFSGLIGTQIILMGHQSFAREKSAREMAGKLQAALPAQAPVFSIAYHDQTLPFYLGRPVTLVAWVDEFATGLRIEPERALPDEASFAQHWQRATAAGAVMRHDTFERLKPLGMQVVYRDDQRVAVVRAVSAPSTPAAPGKPSSRPPTGPPPRGSGKDSTKPRP